MFILNYDYIYVFYIRQVELKLQTNFIHHNHNHNQFPSFYHHSEIQLHSNIINISYHRQNNNYQSTISHMDPLLTNLIDRYLYPDQIIFGHLFNPNIKSQHNYQLTKSTPQLTSNDQLIIYHKQMSKAKIDSMIQMMSGNHPPLFKSSIIPRGKHPEKYQNSQGQQSYSEQQDDYQDYDDQMYLMEKDYQGYFQDQYDHQQNPLMALGQNIGALPKIKNYAKQFNYAPQNHKKNINIQHHKFTKSHITSTQGLGASLLTAQSLQKNQKQQKSKNKNQQNNQSQSDEQWQTDSEQEQQAQFEDQNKK